MEPVMEPSSLGVASMDPPSKAVSIDCMDTLVMPMDTQAGMECAENLPATMALDVPEDTPPLHRTSRAMTKDPIVAGEAEVASLDDAKNVSCEEPGPLDPDHGKAPAPDQEDTPTAEMAPAHPDQPDMGPAEPDEIKASQDLPTGTSEVSPIKE